jgi:hypothetical protein
MFAHSTDCIDDSDCSGSRTCQAGECVGPGGPGEGSGSGSGSGSNGRCSGSDTHYCDSNVLYTCSGAYVRNCDNCSYIGPGTGFEYDTRCKARPSSPTDTFFTTPGCYYGGPPPVCR